MSEFRQKPQTSGEVRFASFWVCTWFEVQDEAEKLYFFKNKILDPPEISTGNRFQGEKNVFFGRFRAIILFPDFRHF